LLFEFNTHISLLSFKVAFDDISSVGKRKRRISVPDEKFGEDKQIPNADHVSVVYYLYLYNKTN
jgi:hypothetical protein